MGAGSNFSQVSSNSAIRTKGGIISMNELRDSTIKKDPLLEELINLKVKINLEEVVFTAKDKSGAIVWLEKGNDISGFEHIKKHAQDFIKKHNIQEKHLESHLKNVIKKGQVISSQNKRLSNGKIGIEKIYKYKNKYYTVAAIGTNGYIVSMYPVDGGK